MSVKDREGILEEVDLQVKEANVASLAIAARVDAEVNRRADLVAKGLVQYEKYEDEMKAKKPDVPAALNEDGEEIRPAGFTKGVFEAPSGFLISVLNHL